MGWTSNIRNKNKQTKSIVNKTKQNKNKTKQNKTCFSRQIRMIKRFPRSLILFPTLYYFSFLLLLPSSSSFFLFLLPLFFFFIHSNHNHLIIVTHIACRTVPKRFVSCRTLLYLLWSYGHVYASCFLFFIFDSLFKTFMIFR